MTPSLLRRLSAFGLCALGLSFFSAGHAFANVFNNLYTFTALTDGNVTYAPLVQGADGRLYGVNTIGGRATRGTIFSLATNGDNFQTINIFTGTEKGATPRGGIVQARDGNFYGTTYETGSNGVGTLFQCVLADGGRINTLAQFNNGTTPGANPAGTLLEGVDGLLYGTAIYGGGNDDGTIFRSDLTGGTLVTLVTLTGGLAGYYPQSDLIQATDGNFYGTTERGGTFANGTFFQVTPAGVYTTLYSFTSGADGGRPQRGVIQGTDGAFYGVCNTGGQYGGGAVYKINYLNAGAFSLVVLHGFLPQALDGADARGNLVQASDGNFYGTTAAGGLYGNGTVYEVTPSGGYDLLYSFTGTNDGSAPYAGLTQATDGKLYGTTAGVNGAAGTVFRIDNGLPAPVPQARFLVQPGAVAGDTILVKGDNFVGAMGVSFTGAGGSLVSATDFAVLSKTVVRAVVPDGAITGPVTVLAGAAGSATPVSLTVTSVTPPPVVTTAAVSIVATHPLASKSDSTLGKFKFIRDGGDTTTALTVHYKLQPKKTTAILGTDYRLTVKGKSVGLIDSVTIPAGKADVVLKVVPIPSTTAAPAKTVVVKITPGDGYNLRSPAKATVQVVSSTVGQ